MSENPPVIVDKKAGWAELIINRPERRNSIIPPVSHAMREALETLATDDDVACVILRGEGGFFCSGVDLKALQADPPPPWKGDQFNAWRQFHLSMFHFPKPVIGAFEKYGINAGAALAFACDILITGETAFLQVGEIQQGSGMPMNAAWLKLKATEQVAARLAFYGDRISGPEMVRLGLAAESVADDEVVARCREIAERIAGHPAGAAMTIKQGLISQRGIDDPEAFFAESTNTALLTAGMVKG
ncbi:MAG: enoyl-CoA hydratase/isomerase family protein [Pseudomonadales bacterium]|nr:enoyl-CoA hydratase/isomerase family protein [Pseudomonadales bacterium]